MANRNEKKTHSSKPSPEKKGPNKYLKFSGLAFELLAFNLVCIWGGIKLDDLLGFKIPWMLICALVISVVGSIYYILRRLN